MTTEKTTRQVTATIQAIAQKEGAGGPYVTITTPARPGRRFPDNFNAWDVSLVEGFKVGDIATLTLQQGKARADNPQSEWDYYWDVVGVAHAIAQVSPEKAAAPQNIAKPSERPLGPDMRDIMIARQVALKAAVEYDERTERGERCSPSAVCQVAQIFLDFLLGKRPQSPVATASQEGASVSSGDVPLTEGRSEALPAVPQKAPGIERPTVALRQAKDAILEKWQLTTKRSRQESIDDLGKAQSAREQRLGHPLRVVDYEAWLEETKKEAKGV